MLICVEGKKSVLVVVMRLKIKISVLGLASHTYNSYYIISTTTKLAKTCTANPLSLMDIIN